MTIEVNMHQAKTDLSKLIAAMEAGERVIIKRAGKPVARIAPIEKSEDAALAELQAKRRALSGSMKGQLILSPDWEEDLPEDMWEHLRPDAE